MEKRGEVELWNALASRHQVEEKKLAKGSEIGRKPEGHGVTGKQNTYFGGEGGQLCQMLLRG